MVVPPEGGVSTTCEEEHEDDNMSSSSSYHLWLCGLALLSSPAVPHLLLGWALIIVCSCVGANLDVLGCCGVDDDRDDGGASGE